MVQCGAYFFVLGTYRTVRYFVSFLRILRRDAVGVVIGNLAGDPMARCCVDMFS